MTEQPTPNGPAAPRPVPDLGFFAGGAKPRGSSTFGSTPFVAAPAPPAAVAFPQPVGPPGFAPFPYQMAPPSRAGLPAWLIAVICVPLAFIVLGVLAAVAIPTFLSQRAKATAAGTTVAFPETVEGLPRLRTPEAESVIQAQVSSVEADLLRDTQGAAYSDGRRHTFFVQVSRFTRVASPQDVDHVLAGFQRSAATDLPPGVTLSVWRDRAPGPLGGRISCATFEGNMTGQLCAAVESTTLLAIVDLVPNASLDTDLPLMVRAAVIHRQR